MSKTKAKGPEYSKVTPALVKQVKDVIADGDKHRYSVSAVYGAYNAAFEKRDTPQTCSSCLRNRVRELRKWLEGYEKYAKENAPKKEDKTPKGDKGKADDNKGQEDPKTGQTGDSGNGDNSEPQYGDPAAPGFVAPAEGVIRTPMAEGLPFDFTPSQEDPKKGTVTLADGTAVKPGTYKTARGLDIAVQVGGRATIKEGPKEGEVINTGDAGNGDNPDDLL